MGNSYRFPSGPIFTHFDKIGMVINVKDEHWFFIGVLPKDGKFVIYDSIPKKGDYYNSYLKKISDFIKKEEK